MFILKIFLEDMITWLEWKRMLEFKEKGEVTVPFILYILL